MLLDTSWFSVTSAALPRGVAAPGVCTSLPPPDDQRLPMFLLACVSKTLLCVGGLVKVDDAGPGSDTLGRGNERGLGRSRRVRGWRREECYTGHKSSGNEHIAWAKEARHCFQRIIERKGWKRLLRWVFRIKGSKRFEVCRFNSTFDKIS